MARLNCFEVEQDLWRYVDRELPASGVAAVSEHLRGCDACRKLYHDRAREANVCRGALSASALGPESSERIVKAMAREGLFRESPPAATGFVRRGDRAIVPFRRRLVLAAVFLLAATAGLSLWLSSPGSPTLLGEFEADGLVHRSVGAEAAFELFGSGSCLAGNGFVVPEDVELTLRLRAPGTAAGATLVVAGPAELTLDAGCTPRRFSAVLKSGLLTARVEPRPAGDPFVVRTLEARVSVVGTEFVVDATAKGVTRLDVSHGAVEFRALDAPVGQRGVLVTAATGAAALRRGDRSPALSPPLSPGAAVSSDRPAARDGSGPPGSTASSEPEVGDESHVQIDSSEPPEGGTGSTGGPTLDRPSGTEVLDQVVNPHREKDEE